MSIRVTYNGISYYRLQILWIIRILPYLYPHLKDGVETVKTSSIHDVF